MAPRLPSKVTSGSGMLVIVTRPSTVLPTPAELKSNAVESKVPGEMLANEPKGSAPETREMGSLVDVPPSGLAMVSIPMIGLPGEKAKSSSSVPAS